MAALAVPIAAPPALAGAKHALAAPACPSSALYGHFPHPNCVLRPWTTNEAMPISGTVRVTKTGTKLKGWYYEVTVSTAYSNPPGNICPVGAVPYSLIPCHYPGVGSQIVGQWVSGSKTLQAAPVSALEYAGCDPHSPCVRHYQISASLNYGRMTLIVAVTQGDVTRAANDLGTAGFEQAITINVPRYTGKPPACLAAGKC
jgi:hypothetical protein